MHQDDEYPHTVTIIKQERVSDGGGGFEFFWKAKFTVPCLLDTPSSREIFEAQQLNNPLNRNLFYAYRTDIFANMRAVYEYDGIVETYDLVGNPQDQGGQREVMQVPLKLVRA